MDMEVRFHQTKGAADPFENVKIEVMDKRFGYEDREWNDKEQSLDRNHAL